MRVPARIFLLLLVAALSAAACRRTLGDDEPKLIVWLDIQSPAETKSTVGTVPAEGSEDAIHDLCIWVFLHDSVDEDPTDDVAFAFFRPNSAVDPLTQYENRYHVFPLPREIALNKPPVDIYVIGNPASVGLDGLGASTTRGTLDNLLMDDNLLTDGNPVFGVKADGTPTCTAVPAEGLPYTGVAKNLSMTGSYPVMRVNAVTVSKAVSKFRFVFCQLRDEAGTMIKKLKIESLSLNGVDAQNQFSENGPNIADSEFLFNDSSKSYKTGNTFRTSPISLTPPSGNIRSYAAPEEYVFNLPANSTSSQRTAYARQYEALINDGINTKKVLTEAGRCYLRETSKRLSGKVSYSYYVGETKEERDATFTMVTAGDFARGSSWIVYVYFIRDAMQFSVSWNGWEDGRDWSLTPIDPMRP